VSKTRLKLDDLVSRLDPVQRAEFALWCSERVKPIVENNKRINSLRLVEACLGQETEAWGRLFSAGQRAYRKTFKRINRLFNKPAGNWDKANAAKSSVSAVAAVLTEHDNNIYAVAAADYAVKAVMEAERVAQRQKLTEMLYEETET